MLAELSEQVQNFIEASKEHFPAMMGIVLILWIFNYINFKTGARLNRWGIQPRRLIGLRGVLFAPLLHADFSHLFFNSLPLFFLGIFAMSLDVILFYVASVIIILLAGLAVWLVGRPGNHIGASALIAGYFGYVLGFAYKQPTFTTLFCAAIALYYFGSILLSLFPSEEGVSWEGHLLGLTAGLIAMWICTHYSDFILSYFT